LTCTKKDRERESLRERIVIIIMGNCISSSTTRKMTEEEEEYFFEKVKNGEDYVYLGGR